MLLPPRVVSRTLTLSCALLGGVAPLACQQIQEWTGGGDKKESPKTDEAGAVAGVDAVGVEPTTPQAVMPLGAATLDSLLALVQADTNHTYMIFRHPEGLLDLGDEAVKFYDGPMQTLVDLLGVQEIASGFGKVKTGLVDVRGKLKESGVDLSRGVVVTQTGADAGSVMLIVTAPAPEAVKNLMVALNLPDAERTICKSLEAAPGHVGCADSEAAVAAYKPGEGAPRRAAAEAALPGVALNELQVLAFVAENSGAHIGLAMPPGLGVLHVSLPVDEGKDVAAMLAPGSAQTLRFARPGTGFLWMRTDVAEMKRRTPELAATGQPQVDAALAAWNGEVFFGGSSDPAAMQLRLGFDDVKAAAAAIEFAGVVGQMGAPKDIPGFVGSKLQFETRELTFGAEATRALHLGVSGVPQADMITQLVGMTPDLWVFAADHSLAIAAGVNADSVTRLVAPATADATIASLPAALAADLRADRVGFVMHTPVDALQGPALSTVLAAAFKDVPGYKPEQVRSGLAMVAPMSSGTMWITESNGQPVVHAALQSIGHTADDEGKAALAAALAVATGGDPAALFGALAAQYPDSARLAAYQARAGSTGPGVLAGSGVAGMLLSGALAYMMFQESEPVALSEKDTLAAELAAEATAKAAAEAAAAEMAALAAAEAAEEAALAAEEARAHGDAAAKKAAEVAKKAADAEKKKADAAAAKKKAEAAAKQKAEEDARKKAEEDARKKAEEAAKTVKVKPVRVGRQN